MNSIDNNRILDVELIKEEIIKEKEELLIKKEPCMYNFSLKITLLNNAGYEEVVYKHLNFFNSFLTHNLIRSLEDLINILNKTQCQKRYTDLIEEKKVKYYDKHNLEANILVVNFEILDKLKKEIKNNSVEEIGRIFKMKIIVDELVRELHVI